MNSSLYVTQPSLPPLEEYTELLADIWSRKWLTNNGHYHRELERQLCEYLDVEHISLFANGTLALITALQCLRITGQVITTPFSFVATTHALHWNNIEPVFCDIDPVTLNLDPNRLESLITPKTTAILPVHVYGYPCNMQALQEIADRYGLTVVYDAAHTFGARQHGRSLCDCGQMSILSFHATKVFNTAEGGAVVCHDAATKQRMEYLKNFGFAGETTVVAPGSNAKMSELHAALGVLQLKRVDECIARRGAVASRYRELLADLPGIRCPQDLPGMQHNYAYFPIRVEGSKYGMDRDALYARLRERTIFARRYFYPLISHFPTYRALPSADPCRLPVAEAVSREVLCLPLFADMTEADVTRVATAIG